MLTKSAAKTAPDTRPAEQTDGPEDLAQLGELLVRTARRLQRSSIAEYGPIGMTRAQAGVMRHLEASGRPLRMAEVAALLEVVPRSATTVVDDLERAGLVVRAVDRSDRRSVLVSLTDKGRRLLERIARARTRTAESTFSRLSGPERAELMRLLATCCDCGPDHGACASLPGAEPPSKEKGGAR